jgi:acyl-CoA thioester hydrolase
MIQKDKIARLSASKEVDVRFSEVDSMGVVWHGSYVKYFEDAREAFGKKYDLGYLKMFDAGVYAPLVKLNFDYKSSITYGKKVIVEIDYIPCEAAKICFEYRVFSVIDGKKELMATGSSVQVFLDKKYQLLWTAPDFYAEWRKHWGVEIEIEQ